MSYDTDEKSNHTQPDPETRPEQILTESVKPVLAEFEGRRGSPCPLKMPYSMICWRHAMFNLVRSLGKKRCLFLLSLVLVLLCGCSSLETSQASPTPTPAAQQASSMPTPAAQQASSTPTSAAQTAFTSYVGKWQVHDSLLTINASSTGLELWNAGPCSASALCNGNAQITFTENADGSIKGNIQSVSYTQWNGNPAPSGYQPDPSAPQAGDTFQLQHSGAHLLYTTWFGKGSSLNQNNRYWCDSYALKAGWQQCGA